MKINKYSHLYYSIKIGDLIAYLQYKGWQLIDDDSNRFITFYGPKDIENNPIEIVFLRKLFAREQSLYITNAIEILCSLTDADPLSIIFEVNNVNRDNLRIRLLDIEPGDAISLKNAAIQINELKQLVAYAACSEIDQQPFYLNWQKYSSTNNLLEEFRFGHTFKGSFGFSIETPRFIEIYNYEQLSLLPEIIKKKSNIPRSRKIMERIVKGLSHTQEAILQQNPQFIMDNYSIGLNANMCQALAKMIKVSKRVQNLEYTIKWAALLLPDDPSIINIGPIQLNESAYNHLEYAANQLMELPSEKITINGLIIDLSAKDSPSSLDTSRMVTIRWDDKEEGKAYEAIAYLTVEDYYLAIQAHKNWNIVKITGQLSKQKQKWRFISYSQFKII